MARTYGVSSGNVVQLGKEATAGTAVPAVYVWRGMSGSFEDWDNLKLLQEEVGTLYNVSETTYDLMKGVDFSLPETDMTLEQLAIILDAGIQAATPSGVGPYVRTYNDVPGTVNAVSTWTIETGNADVTDDTQQLVQAVVDEFTLSAEANAPWKISSAWIAKSASAAALTAALALPAVTVATLPMTKLYIDTAAGTAKTTQLTGVLMGAKIQRKTGFKPVLVGDGSRNFTVYKQVPPEATFAITIELEKDVTSLASAERAAWRSRAIRQFGLEILSDAASPQCVVTWAGRYSRINGYENREGNTVLTLEGRMVNLAAKSLFMKFVHTSSIAVL